MKKFLLLMAAMIVSCCAFSQTRVVVGDMNGDGKLTVDDVSLLTDDILHNRCSAYYTDCELIYSRDGEYHEWVDLGLPSGTLWATCNIGSQSPEEYGDYYAWGETEPQADNVYSWASYSLCKGSYNTMTKYCQESKYGYNGFTDTLTELESADDAATVNWGADWQMPSLTQQTELRSNCYWEYVTSYNGKSVEGYIVYKAKSDSDKGKYKCSGSSTTPSASYSLSDGHIFLPAAGCRGDGSLLNAGSYGYYWSRSLPTPGSGYAYYLYFHSSGIYGEYSSRFYGLSVRPVRVDKNVTSTTAVSAITLSQSTATLKTGENVTLTTIVEPADATDASVTWSSSDESVATISSEGIVTAVAAGTATITATANDGSGVVGTCTVVVKAPDTMEYVDLGLPTGTLWATCNVGSSSPEEYGDYFAWGETEPQADNRYSWASYKWSNGGTSYDNPNLTKYCQQSKYGYNGFTDTLTELESSDDAATVNWGSEWQMPSSTQRDELKNNCYWEWVTSYNGKSVKGYIVYKAKSDSDKGKKKYSGSSTTTSASYSLSDDHIFLPAAGYRGDGSLYNAGSYGYYWSRSLYTSVSRSACGLGFYSSDVGGDYSGRYGGQSVRPVRVSKN